ncbi:FkbM family methyltransferase [Bradyrhizobium sp.]|uniref:FkbM family methyltransferase n=1 Tax=Bradyrhizobium sp. TaxID=376 RepID=UPI0039E58342
MATVTDVENCYRYILGREMSAEERHGIDGDFVTGRQVGDLRAQFLTSREFHDAHLETLFDNLVPQSIPVLYETNLGFKIYLDLRQLHITFGVLQETYERAEVELLRRMVPDDGVFLDVGANCGYFSLAIAARKNFSGKVIAFEPLLPLSSLLEQSISVNGWSDRIELRQMALGSERGTLPLTDAEISINAGATRLAIGKSSRPSHRIVAVDALDNIAGDTIPDAIKVDIEGAEGLFLHGARGTIHRSKPAVLFEVNPELLTMVSNVAPADLQRWFQDHGYRLWAVEPERLHPVPANQNIGEMIGPRGMKNFLAIHADRLPMLRDRLGLAPN